MPLLELKNLRTHFRAHGKVNRSVDGVSFSVEPRQIVAVVGESGCGKSVTAMSIMRLLDPLTSRSGGEVWFDGVELLGAPREVMDPLRGRAISMVFQDPMTSLNPVLRIGYQFEEVLRRHQSMTRKQARTRTLELLERVRISEPRRRYRQYPHELSGGMRQRVMIAMALACQPRLLLADEPTTALDVTVQAQILQLLRNLRDETGTAIIMITHDLGVVAEIAERVVVMYAGRKVEEASVAELFSHPQHPYTRALMASMPRLGGHCGASGRTRLTEIPGVVPSLVDDIAGCIFAPRCTQAQAQCRTTYPPEVILADGHAVSCWNIVSAQESEHGHA